MTEAVDWSHCSFVDVNPRVHGGVPVLRGTRLPVSAIVDNFDDGMSPSEIAEQFQVSIHRVQEVLDYVASHRVAHSV